MWWWLPRLSPAHPHMAAVGEPPGHPENPQGWGCEPEQPQLELSSAPSTAHMRKELLGHMFGSGWVNPSPAWLWGWWCWEQHRAGRGTPGRAAGASTLRFPARAWAENAACSEHK